MTDNEIIKALECCKNKRCVNCPYDDIADTFSECSAKLVKDALDLINRQKAEIENKNRQIGELVSFQRFCERKAIKEFAEKLLSTKIKPESPWDDFFVTETAINDLVKEITEETST